MNETTDQGNDHPLAEYLKSYDEAITSEAFWIALRRRESRAFLLGALYGVCSSIVILVLSWWAHS